MFIDTQQSLSIQNRDNFYYNLHFFFCLNYALYQVLMAHAGNGKLWDYKHIRNFSMRFLCDILKIIFFMNKIKPGKITK